MNGSSSAPSRLAQRWMAIANALDLRVIAPASILLPSGQRVDADALLPGFGGPRGMLLVTDDELVWTHRVAIVGAGYGFSVLSDPGPRADVLPSLDDVIDMLRDWGWEGDPGDEPAWMRET